MRTPIYTTKKLEKSIRKLIQIPSSEDCGILGKWNATLFFVERKKCWLLSNAKTQYNVILTYIRASDLKDINDHFKNAFYGQLIYDSILMTYTELSTQIGDLEFMSTDNDKKTIGFQNHRLQDLEYWKYEYGSLENMPIKELTHRMNTIPIHIGKGRKMSDYTTAIDEIASLLTNL